MCVCVGVCVCVCVWFFLFSYISVIEWRLQNYFEFEISVQGRKPHQIRTTNDGERTEWIKAINLVGIYTCLLIACRCVSRKRESMRHLEVMFLLLCYSSYELLLFSEIHFAQAKARHLKTGKIDLNEMRVKEAIGVTKNEQIYRYSQSHSPASSPRS